MSGLYFGTDGVRGKVGEGKMTPSKILHLGWAAGMALRNHGSASVLIGKDTRLSGYLLEGALQAGFTAAGVDVKMLGPIPTPGISYLTQTFRAEAGVVISASHNPYYDNGVKLFGPDGKKISDEIQKDIEAYMAMPMSTVNSDDIGRVTRIEGAAERYIEFCKGRFPSRYSLESMRIVVDCANGATYHIAPKVFRELGAEVIVIGDKPSGSNINEGVGATSPGALVDAVKHHEADLGIAFDGDGDRLIMVDENGGVVDGDQLVYILARDALKNGRLVGGVVGTLMTNKGMEDALVKLGIPFFRAQVGDRYVLAELEKRGWHIGGEGSGHILNLRNSPTGDAIVAALQVLTTIERCQMPLSKLNQGYTPMAQCMKNMPLDARDDVVNDMDVDAEIKALESTFDGRVLLRPSGTEPLLRVMAEAGTYAKAEEVVNKIVALIEDKYGVA